MSENTREAPKPVINSNVMVESLDPTGRPMEKIPVLTPEVPQKRNVGLIISIAIVALVVFCAIVAIILVAVLNG